MHENIIHILDNCCDILATVLWHTLLYRSEVLPVVVDSLNRRRRCVVCPESTWSQLLGPSCQCTGVRSAREYPWCFISIGAMIGVEREGDCLCEVGEIENGLVQSQ